MKILYIANIRMPTEKAHGYQIIKMCQAFKRQGIDIELVVAKRLNKKLNNFDIFDFYGIKDRFKIKKIFCIDAINPIFNKFGSLGFIIQIFSFILFLIPYILFKKTDCLYCRDELVVYILSFFRKNIIYEAHTYSRLCLKASQRLQKKTGKIIAISHGIKDKLVEQGIASSQIIVSPDGVDPEDFNIKEGKNESRNMLGLPIGRKIVMYTGHLFGWKGVYVLAEASQYLGNNMSIVFVGGMPNDLDKLKKYILDRNLHNIILTGYKRHQEIPRYLNTADVLVLPNSGKFDISKYYTSPLKLFEYMAAEKPIIASNLPAIREILNSDEAYFFTPDDPKDLSRSIIDAIANPRPEIPIRAFQKVRLYSWQKRAENIIKFFK